MWWLSYKLRKLTNLYEAQKNEGRYNHRHKAQTGQTLAIL